MGISWMGGAARCTIAVWIGVALAAGTASAQSVCTPSPDNPTAEFETNLGDFDVLLCRADVAATVDNFVQYVNDGAYTTTGFVHRVTKTPASGIDVVQGGGFYVGAGDIIQPVTARAPIALQAQLPNVAGTIAMARTNDPNSATSQWFINVLDNPALDPGPGGAGYAVFGEVTSGMSVVDAIHSQEIWALGAGTFGEVPLINYPNDGVSSPLPYLVLVTQVTVVPEPAAVMQGIAVLATLALLAARRRRVPR